MFIGICGPICAGKSSIAKFLEQEHSFKRVRLARTAATPAVEKSANNANVPLDDRAAEDVFATIDDLLDYVTKRWQEKWVTTDIWDENVLDALIRRPFFLLVSVDAPISIRWQRFKTRCTRHNLEPPDLASFVLRSDEHLYSPGIGLAPLLHRAQLRLLNSCSTIDDLSDALRGLDLTDEVRLRPSWDQYFMQLAGLAAQRCNCMKRRVGCVLVRDYRVISTGYNGTPRGTKNCNKGGCPRCNQGNKAGVSLATCLCLHAEENALLEAGRERIGTGATLYCDTCPCLTCSVKIAQVGVSEVVYSQGYSMDEMGAAVLSEGGVRLRQFLPPQEGLVDLGAICLELSSRSKPQPRSS